MTSGFSRTDTGLSPELREAARAAAQRSGMSVDEWLRATIGESAAAASAGAPSHGSIGGRLDQLSSRIGRPERSTPGPTGAGEPTARLADTVARLNERLDQLTAGRAAFGDVDQRMSSVRGELESLRRNQSPSIAPEAGPLGIDRAVAEISARQRVLDEGTEQPRGAGTASGADIASLHAQLHQITEQIETLRQPSSVEDAIAGLRRDLGEIANTINEAMPRRALDALQGEVHALAERIEQGYGRGADPSALAHIESALGEVVQAINSMTPAEGLGGFEQQVRALSAKLDGLSGGIPDLEVVHSLQSVIGEMRGFAEHVASAEGLAALRADVHAVADRIDRIAVATGAGNLESLAQRVDDLTRALDARGTDRVELPQNLESLVHALSAKLDQHGAPQAHDHAGFDQLERQIGRLADKIEVADQHFGNIGAIERGISLLMEQVQQARADAVAAAERVARSVATDGGYGAAPEVSTLKRDLASLQANQSETHDTLEAVHDTLERLVERLAMVETGIRTDAPPAAVETARARESFSVLPQAAAPAAAKPAAPVVQVPRRDRPPIDPDLPADTPLEPGIGIRARTPAERIAASEAALSPMKREETSEISGKASFIAAARRAAQAAASEGAPVESGRAEEGKEDEPPTSMIGRFLANRRRALMIGVGVLLVLYGATQVFNMMSRSEDRPAEQSRPSSGQITPPGPEQSKLAIPAAPAEAEPVAPTPAPSRQSAISPAVPFVAPVATTAMITATPMQTAIPKPAATQPPTTPPAGDVTGSVTQPQIATLTAPKPASAEPPLSLQAPSLSDKLPTGIGGPALRAAAAAGNPAAEYEIGLRYAEGRGVTLDQDLAVRWFERAAQQGIAPALYRLGSLYEKGQGVKKDLNKARTLYLQAADKGNAKAVHNLAVLYAEGIDGKPDYRTASQWFRKAADRGVADSQYNLGILYARGIGVDQNLAESYKWFALAANQGDQDAAKKRDDVAARLDQQSLVAAKLAVQTFAVDPPPDEAMNVKAPPGGWDRATATPAKPAETRRKGT
jgi:localization factor PodJL